MFNHLRRLNKKFISNLANEILQVYLKRDFHYSYDEPYPYGQFCRLIFGLHHLIKIKQKLSQFKLNTKYRNLFWGFDLKISS